MFFDLHHVHVFAASGGVDVRKRQFCSTKNWPAHGMYYWRLEVGVSTCTTNLRGIRGTEPFTIWECLHQVWQRLQPDGVVSKNGLHDFGNWRYVMISASSFLICSFSWLQTAITSSARTIWSTPSGAGAPSRMLHPIAGGPCASRLLLHANVDQLTFSQIASSRFKRCCPISSHIRRFPENASTRRSGIPMMNNRRHERQGALTPGTILFQDSKIDCAVHDVSVGGANLEVDSQIAIPNSFDLLIAAETGKQRCHVVWRKGPRMGVAFS
jgi:PilZ domain-containing protein